MAEYDDKKPRAEDLLFMPVIPRNLTLLPVLALTPSRMSYARTKKPTLSAKKGPFCLAVIGPSMAKGVAAMVAVIGQNMTMGRGAGPSPTAPSGPGFGGGK